jgi:cytochrome c biogenesis protein CcmG/thiol:disulfide interchange protein DsbE
LVLAGALAVVLFSSLGSKGTPIPTVGSPAPAFSLTALGGRGTVGIPADGGSGGRPVVLVFFASWCPPCRAEMPALAHAYRDQPRRSRVAIVGVDGMDSPAAARRFVQASGVTFPVAADSRYSVTEALYALTGEPDAVFVKGDGTIARIVHGPITAAELLAWERTLG